MFRYGGGNSNKSSLQRFGRYVFLSTWRKDLFVPRKMSASTCFDSVMSHVLKKKQTNNFEGSRYVQVHEPSGVGGSKAEKVAVYPYRASNQEKLFTALFPPIPCTTDQGPSSGPSTSLGTERFQPHNEGLVKKVALRLVLCFKAEATPCASAQVRNLERCGGPFNKRRKRSPERRICSPGLGTRTKQGGIHPGTRNIISSSPILSTRAQWRVAAISTSTNIL